MDIRELSHRVHQLSAREELMLTASKLASVPVEEVSEFGKVFPDLELSSKSCRAGLVRFLFGRYLHYTLLFLLGIDVLLVVAGLQLQIEIVSMEGTAVTNCFVDAVEPEGPHHHMESVEDAKRCVEEQHTHQVAEQFAEVEHIFTLVSLGILCVFLVENLLFIVAFRWRYFTIWFFPLDLFVVLMSLGAEIGQLAWTSHTGSSLTPATELGTAASMFYEGVSAWAGLLILARLWRFARIGHAVFLLREAEEYEEELAEEEGFKDLETCSAEVQRPEGPRAEVEI